jgi:hypothetical protein
MSDPFRQANPWHCKCGASFFSLARLVAHKLICHKAK